MFLKLNNGYTYTFIDVDDNDVQIISENDQKWQKRFISKLNHKNESFKMTVRRIAQRISNENKSNIYFLN